MADRRGFGDAQPRIWLSTQLCVRSANRIGILEDLVARAVLVTPGSAPAHFPGNRVGASIALMSGIDSRGIQAAENRRQKEVDRARHRAEDEADRQRRRAEEEADRTRNQLASLRTKALGEQAKGKPGVWTAEYESKLAELQAREQARIAQEQARAQWAARAAAEASRLAEEKRKREAAAFRALGIAALVVVVLGAILCAVLFLSQERNQVTPAPTNKAAPPTRKR